MNKFKKYTAAACAIVIGVIAIAVVLNMFEIVPSGYVGVGDVFGKVQQVVYEEGFNTKAPWVTVTPYDAREKTKKVTLGVPSKDQQTTMFDISIQYRLIKSKAPMMKSETGTMQEVVDVHMEPLINSVTREIGKGVEKAEMFFEQGIQARMQNELYSKLSILSDKGIKIEKLLIRDVRLPKNILKAIESKKAVAQSAEKAIEELKKFRVDQQQKKEKALAEKEADVIEAQKKAEVALTIANGNLASARINSQATIINAKAEAEAKKLITDIIGREGYVTLETAKVLPQLANGNHIIMMDPSKNNMLPFMDMTKLR